MSELATSHVQALVLPYRFATTYLILFYTYHINNKLFI